MYSVTNAPYTVAPIQPGECALVLVNGEVANFPVLLLNGYPNQATVAEVPEGDAFHVSDTSLQGGRSGLRPVFFCIPWVGCFFIDTFAVAFDVGPNTNTVHFTNTAGPPPNGGPFLPCPPICFGG
jgi:hypothetical protein